VLKRYVAKRLLIAIPSLLIASLIVFTLPRLIPGDAVQLMLAEKSYAKDIDELRAKLGLDRPLYVQYFEWAGRVVRTTPGGRDAAPTRCTSLALRFRSTAASARPADSPASRRDCRRASPVRATGFVRRRVIRGVRSDS